MKTKIVMPPYGIFQKEDMYCQKYWWQDQHVSHDFGLNGKKKFLLLGSLVRNEIPENEIFKHQQ